jgi:hypothetical protein
LKSSSPNQPSYQHFNLYPEYQSNYQRHPSQYYQAYNYTPHTSQVNTPQLTITYPSAPLQIMYPTASSQTTKPKTKPDNPPPPPPHNQESSQQATSFLAFGTIHTITGSSNLSFENKRQRQEYYRQVNHVAVEGPYVRAKWSHVQITFIEADIKLASFPHTDAMVITTHINKWNVMRVLVDNRNQEEILFLSTFEQMGLNKK